MDSFSLTSSDWTREKNLGTQCGLPQKFLSLCNSHTNTKAHWRVERFLCSATQKEEPNDSCLPFVSHLFSGEGEWRRNGRRERERWSSGLDPSARRQQRPRYKKRNDKLERWKQVSRSSQMLLRQIPLTILILELNVHSSPVPCAFLLLAFFLTPGEFSSTQRNEIFLVRRNSEIGDWEKCNKKEEEKTVCNFSLFLAGVCGSSGISVQFRVLRSQIENQFKFDNCHWQNRFIDATWDVTLEFKPLDRENDSSRTLEWLSTCLCYQTSSKSSLDTKTTSITSFHPNFPWKSARKHTKPPIPPKSLLLRLEKSFHCSCLLPPA